VQSTSFKLSTLSVRHPSGIPSDRLLIDETFEQPCVFAVVNCADVALSAFYSSVLTLCRIFSQLRIALSLIPLIIYVHYSGKLQPAATSKESACRITCTWMPKNGAFIPLSFKKGSTKVEVHFRHRCKSRQIFGVRRVFVRISPNSPKGFCVTFAYKFSPRNIKTSFCCNLQKRSSCVFLQILSVIFYPDFQEFCADFQQTKTFEGELAPPPATPLLFITVS